MAVYRSSSPWYDSSIVNDSYLGLLNKRPIPKENDDIRYVITNYGGYLLRET